LACPEPTRCAKFSLMYAIGRWAVSGAILDAGRYVACDGLSEILTVSFHDRRHDG
jgi:hypothetical protein